MNKSALKEEILELCAEDNFGLWELWWPIAGHHKRGKPDIEPFSEVIKELICARQIQALSKTSRGFDAVDLEINRLTNEIHAIMAGEISENMYWFGKPYNFEGQKTTVPNRLKD